jgi:hypothetical protein
MIARWGKLGKLGILGMLIVPVAFAGAAFAQTGTGSAAAGGAAAGSSATGASEPPPSPTPLPAQPASDARKACTDAMNADPQFAAAIVKIADEKAAVANEKAATQRDADTLAAHEAANAQVQENERHVIYAYAAMWIVAALFVIFLWRRQQALKGEIASLRRDLDAAEGDPTTDKGRA